MRKRAKLADWFGQEHADRHAILERARLCASLAKPWILPEENMRADEALPENYQSIGSRGLTNLEGRLLLAMYPPMQPWFKLDLDSQYRYDPSIPDEIKQAFQSWLFLREMQVISQLESCNAVSYRKARRSGFRAVKRAVFSQLLATGDTLEQLTDEYRIKLFRRDKYVTKRDSSGDVLYHIILEEIDPLSLPDDKQIAAQLDQRVYEAEYAKDRMQKLYTLVEWQPDTRTWLIEQEINGNTIHSDTERISPFISTAFELAPGENYGRGMVELNLGDLRSLDEQEERRLDLLALATKGLVVRDPGSLIRDKDLEKKSGSIITGRVQNGRAQDIAMLHMENMREFAMINDAIRSKTVELGKAFLLETDVQPQQERVTATQVQRIAAELESALGGLYAPLADEQQLPLVERAIYQMERDRLLVPAPDQANKATRIQIQTGLAALTREMNAAKIGSIVGMLAQIPEAIAKIDWHVFTDLMFRYQGVYEPGLVKTREQVEAEMQQAMEAQMAQQAAGKAVDVIGNAAEAQMAPQPTGA